MKSLIDLDHTILHHTHWKYHLKQAIEAGQSELTVIGARNPHLCAFGKWLDSTEGKMLPHYLEIVELHQHFHEEAAKVLDLALQGQTSQAREGLQLGSPFNQATAKLINKLGEIRETLEPVRKVLK
jgi:hypothetical protein